MTAESLILAIHDFMQRNGESDTLDLLAEVHDQIARDMGASMPEAVRIAYEMAGRDDVLIGEVLQ